MTGDDEHLFLFLFAIVISFSVKFFCLFPNWIFLLEFLEFFVLDPSPCQIHHF